MGIVVTIDDSRVVLMKLGKILSDAGCEVETALNGTDGIQVVKGHRDAGIDFVFIDFNMPGIDGIEAATEIVKLVDPEKIYLLTANIQEAIRERAKDIGIQFINKNDMDSAVREIVKSGLGAS